MPWSQRSLDAVQPFWAQCVSIRRSGFQKCDERVGVVGWRGMVGSVLMQRMHAERDFALMEPVFFSTSRVGELGPSSRGSVTLSRLKRARFRAEWPELAHSRSGEKYRSINGVALACMRCISTIRPFRANRRLRLASSHFLKARSAYAKH